MTETTPEVIGVYTATGLFLIAACLLCIGWYVGEKSVVFPTIALNPVADFGAVCDMKTDDTKEFMLAGKLAARLGGVVEVPNNCVVRNEFLKNGEGHFVGKDYRP